MKLLDPFRGQLSHDCNKHLMYNRHLAYDYLFNSCSLKLPFSQLLI